LLPDVSSTLDSKNNVIQITTTTTKKKAHTLTSVVRFGSGMMVSHFINKVVLTWNDSRIDTAEVISNLVYSQHCVVKELTQTLVLKHIYNEMFFLFK